MTWEPHSTCSRSHAMAAEAGAKAKRVCAIEARQEAAASVREVIKAKKFEIKVAILEGVFGRDNQSSPRRSFEIVGSVATEERARSPRSSTRRGGL